MNEELRKAIDEACINYCEQVNSVYNEKDVFKAGAIFVLSKWQESERWRNVDEELPEYGETVLIKTKPYGIDVAIRKHEEYFETNSRTLDVNSITEWKPIN